MGIFQKYLFHKIIKQYFNVSNKNKYTTYDNFRLPIYTIKELFPISAPKILYIDEKDYLVIKNQSTEFLVSEILITFDLYRFLYLNFRFILTYREPPV